jgi:rubredoxin
MATIEFTLICNKCGTIYGTENTAPGLVDMIDEAIISNYWKEVEGKYLCPECNGHYDSLNEEGEE